MKKNVFLILSAILTCGLWASMLTSCVDSKDNPIGDTPVTPVVDEADYTVMLYTVGGGNLDNSIENDIASAAKALKAGNKKVRYLVQYKYSSQKELEKLAGFSPSGKAGHVYRYEATPSIANSEKESTDLNLTDADIYGTQNEKAEFFQPDSLASFMKYCQKVAPAKNYILMLSDHGGGYSQTADVDKSLVNAGRRAVLYDDNVGEKGLTCKELRAGIEQSGMHLTMLNFDCCLMNNMEVLSELTELTDYVLASGHTIAGEDHKAFVEELYKASADGQFTEAMSRYAKACTEYNYKLSKIDPSATWCLNVDFVLTDMKKFPAVLTALKEFVDFVISNKNDDFADEYQYAATTSYQYYPNVPLYDLKDYCSKLNSYVYGTMADTPWWEPMDKLEHAIEAAQITHTYALQSSGLEYAEIPPYYLSYSVSLGAKGFIGCLRAPDAPGKMKGYTKDGYKAVLDMGTLEVSTSGEADPALAWSNGYNLLAFDQKTGWSRWLEVNTGFPLINPPYDNASDKLPTGAPATSKEWKVSFIAEYEPDKATMKNFILKNTVFWTNDPGFSSLPLMSPFFKYQVVDAVMPGKGQFIMEVTPRSGKEGNWSFVRKGLRIMVSKIHNGKELPVEQYTFDDLNLSGTVIQTEGEEVAKKAYVNVEVSIDKDGNVTFTKHDQSENYIVEK